MSAPLYGLYAVPAGSRYHTDNGYGKQAIQEGGEPENSGFSPSMKQ